MRGGGEGVEERKPLKLSSHHNDEINLRASLSPPKPVSIAEDQAKLYCKAQKTVTDPKP